VEKRPRPKEKVQRKRSLLLVFHTYERREGGREGGREGRVRRRRRWRVNALLS